MHYRWCMFLLKMSLATELVSSKWLYSIAIFIPSTELYFNTINKSEFWNSTDENFMWYVRSGYLKKKTLGTHIWHWYMSYCIPWPHKHIFWHQKQVSMSSRSWDIAKNRFFCLSEAAILNFANKKFSPRVPVWHPAEICLAGAQLP